MRKRVLAVGDINTDIVFTGLSSIPASEQESVAAGLAVTVGGQTCTAARALSRLGLDVTFVGRVGADRGGSEAVRVLAAAGVDTRGVIVDPVLATGTTVVLSTGTERAFATYCGSAGALRRSDVPPDLLEAADHLHVGSFYLQQALQPGLSELLQQAAGLGLTTSLDPGWDPSGRWSPDILDVLPLVDVFLPNEREAMAMTRASSPRGALEILARHGGTVVIKRGGRGCVAADATGAVECAAFTVEVADVTSAGDVFNAGFLFSFLAGRRLEESVRFAAACGAIAVSRAGSTGMPAREAQVEQFLAGRPGEAQTRRVSLRAARSRANPPKRENPGDQKGRQ